MMLGKNLIDRHPGSREAAIRDPSLAQTRAAPWVPDRRAQARVVRDDVQVCVAGRSGG
jgi:hypothetical protein